MTTLVACMTWGRPRCGAVATYGDRGSGSGGGGFRVSFGLVKEIVTPGPVFPLQARLRELVGLVRPVVLGGGRVARWSGRAPDDAQAWAACVGVAHRVVGSAWEAGLPCWAVRVSGPREGLSRRW